MTQYRYNMKNASNEFEPDEDNYSVNPTINDNSYLSGQNMNNRQRSRTPEKKSSNKMETLFYKYRWWVVILLACLLVYFLYVRKCDGLLSFSEMTNDKETNIRWIDPQLTQSFDNLDQRAVPINTDIRRLFNY